MTEHLRQIRPLATVIAIVVKRAALVLAAGAVGYLLAEYTGPAAAAVIFAIAAAAACATGAVLLRTSELNRVTWRNRAAGHLIPWGWGLNRGRLWPVAIVSWVVWVVIGTSAIILRTEPVERGVDIGVRAALFTAWVLDGAALMSVSGALCRATPGSRVGSLWVLVGATTALLVGSVGLFLAGWSDLALVVGGGPPAAVGGFAGLVTLLFVTVGRNARWN